jgi:hypothetical protein
MIGFMMNFDGGLLFLWPHEQSVLIPIGNDYQQQLKEENYFSICYLISKKVEDVFRKIKKIVLSEYNILFSWSFHVGILIINQVWQL